MAAEKRSPWRLAAALLLLVTVPVYGSIPPLPPTAPEPELVSAAQLDGFAAPSETLLLAALCRVYEAPSVSALGRSAAKARVGASGPPPATQHPAIQWFSCEIAVGRGVVDYLVDTAGALSQVVAESVVDEGTGAEILQAYYVRGDDLLSVMRPDGAGWATRFYHADGLGSIRALTDESGAVTDRYTFTAFGELIEHTGEDPNAYLFAGEMLDPNAGFYYLRARWMDPSVGRFVSMDPWGGSAYRPSTLHRYLYAEADPVLRRDPTGRFSMVEVGLVLVGAVIGAHFAIVAMRPSAATRRLTAGLFVQAHPVAGQFEHLSLRIIPTDQVLWRARERDLFDNRNDRGLWFATIGAGPENGLLVSDWNRNNDVHQPKTHSERLFITINENQAIQRLIDLDSRYRDNLDYDLFPESSNPLWADGYNSNSYIHGLLLAAGLPLPRFAMAMNLPGFASPLPPYEFR